MAGRFGALSALMASAGITPPAADTAPRAQEPDAALPEDVTAEQLTAALTAAKAAGHAEGVAAERGRTAEVLGSAPAQANVAGAAFLLAETDTSAAKIVENLPKIAASAAPAAPVAADAPKPALSVPLENTPKITVGAGDPKPEPSADDIWNGVLEERADQSPFAPAAITSGGVTIPRSGH
jgi:hypothetical protein